MWYLTGDPNFSHMSLDDAFSDEEVVRIRSYFDNQDAELGKIGNSIDEALRKSKINWLYNHDGESDWLYRKLTDYVNEANTKYFKYDLHFLESIQLSEYNESYQGKYAKHVDYGFTELINRKLSFTVQLSDPWEYEGGNLLLYPGSDTVSITKKKGSLTLFSSFMLHEVTEVTQGTRLSAVGWVSGPKFK